MVGALSVTLPAGQADAFTPWEPLAADSWIYFGAPQARLILHTANAGDYEVGFDQAGGGAAARGMNALRFAFGGADTGHLTTGATSGSVEVKNVGNTRTFRDLIILVAIDAEVLGPGFGMTLGVQGQTPYTFDPVGDFGYYDEPTYDTGRPSAYYSLTTPSSEEVSYLFEQATVTVCSVQNVNLGPSGSVVLDYAFANLPGTAVFSVYGMDADVGWIYHTNRTVIDENNPTKPVSTFAVVPPAVPALSAWGLAAGATILVTVGGATLRRRHK